MLWKPPVWEISMHVVGPPRGAPKWAHQYTAPLKTAKVLLWVRSYGNWCGRHRMNILVTWVIKSNQWFKRKWYPYKVFRIIWKHGICNKTHQTYSHTKKYWSFSFRYSHRCLRHWNKAVKTKPIKSWWAWEGMCALASFSLLKAVTLLLLLVFLNCKGSLCFPETKDGL